MKLGIVIGHNSRQSGAFGVAPIKASEFDFNSEVAEIMDEMAGEFGFDAKVFKRIDRSSYAQEIREVYKKTDTWGAQVSIELHFNAFDGKTRGTEVLAGPSSDSLRTAMAVHKSLVALFKRDFKTDRGVKDYRPGIRGELSLISGRAPAILVEPFFGDSAEDAKLMTELGKPALARAYLAGLAKAWSLTPDAAKPAEDLVAALDFAHWR